MKLGEIQKLTAQFPVPADPTQWQFVQKQLSELLQSTDNFYQELEMESRFVDTHRDTSFSNDMVGLHSHAFYEFLCCSNTCGAEYLVGSDRYRLQKGDIILVPPGVSHRPILPPDMPKPYHRYVLWLSTEFISAMMEAFPQHNLYKAAGARMLRTAGTKWAYLEDLFLQGVLEAEQKKPGWEAVVAANSVTLLTMMSRAVSERTAHPLKAEKPELLDQAIAFIESNLNRKITLADVARHLYVSESTISQTFRKKMGVSFHRCLTQRRLVEAKTLIGQGFPMEQAGIQVGFQDYSCFYRAFKAEYGISPAHYRKITQV